MAHHVYVKHPNEVAEYVTTFESTTFEDSKAAIDHAQQALDDHPAVFAGGDLVIVVRTEAHDEPTVVRTEAHDVPTVWIYGTRPAKVTLLREDEH